MVRNVIGVVVGFIAGSVVNYGLILIGMAIMPAGTDFSTPEGVNQAIGQMGAINFAMVFLAHAMGAFAGARVAAAISTTHKLATGMVIGVLFLLGGIYAAVVIDAPLWFEAVDILFAYIPFAFLGAKLANGGRPS